MKKYPIILIFIVAFIFSCEEEPTIKESLDYIKSELDSHPFHFGKNGRNEIQNVSFKILNYDRCECEYRYTFFYDQKKSFRETQKFNLLDAGHSYSYPELGKHTIEINLSNKSNERTVNPIDTNVHNYEVVKIDKILLNIRVEQKDRLLKAVQQSVKLCSKKIRKDFFE